MEMIQKFLADHAALLSVLFIVNIVLGCVGVVCAKIQESVGDKYPFLGKLAGIAQKISEFLSANLPHKDAAPKV